MGRALAFPRKMMDYSFMKLPLFLLSLFSFCAFLQAETPAKPIAPAPDLPTNPAAVISPLNPLLPTIFVAGDSTAANNNGNPIQGWATPFSSFFDPAKVNVANRALGGRSSRTFITEGHWDRLLNDLKAGDYVLIQFGHNDSGAINEEPPGSNRPLRARGSLPGLGEESKEIDNVLTKKHEVVHTYGWYMRKMIADVKAKGATPILLSLTVRDIWRAGSIERGSGQYRQWIRELAQTSKIGFIDLTCIAADEFQNKGENAAKNFFAPDRTHSNTAGAELNAQLVVSGMKGMRKGPFEALLSPKGLAVVPDRNGWLNLPEPANPSLPTLLFIGDSTVRNGRGDGEGGQWGWGDLINDYFDASKINVVNRAVGGLSSRTFYSQGHWQRALNLLKKGDYLLIQFGHNDDAGVNDGIRSRGTIKGVGEETQEIDNILTKQHEVVHTYGWYLRSFIREAKAKGVTPIVCSLVPRKNWVDGKISRHSESYAKWARQVAESEQVGFIDLNELIAKRYEELGQAKVETFFADPHTHTSRDGAILNASIVLGGLRAQPGDPLAGFLSPAGQAANK
jgi:lysophospholipase L1-like esterase